MRPPRLGERSIQTYPLIAKCLETTLAPAGVIPGQCQALDDCDQQEERDAQQRGHQDSSHHRRGGKCVLLELQEESQTFTGAYILCEYRADNAVGNGDTYSGEERRERPRQLHHPVESNPASAERAAELEQIRIR